MEQNIEQLMNNYEKSIIHVMKITKGEERDKEIIDICEVLIAENFWELMTDAKSQMQEDNTKKNQYWRST